MVNYGEAIKRPFSDIKKLLLGILLSLIPIVNFLAVGYQMECAKTAMKKKFAMPEWTNLGEMFVQGLMYAVIGMLYFIPLVILFILLAVVTGAFSALGSIKIMDVVAGEYSSILPALAGFAGVVAVFGLILLVLSYLSYSAILGYINTGKLGAAFDFKTIFKKSFTGTYFVAWLVSLCYGIAVAIVIGWIPWLGTGVSGFISGVTSLTIMGEAYASIK